VVLLFVVFLVWSDPNGAGVTVTQFVGWVGSKFGSLLDVVDGLLGPGPVGDEGPGW